MSEIPTEVLKVFTSIQSGDPGASLYAGEHDEWMVVSTRYLYSIGRYQGNRIVVWQEDRPNARTCIRNDLEGWTDI